MRLDLFLFLWWIMMHEPELFWSRFPAQKIPNNLKIWQRGLWQIPRILDMNHFNKLYTCTGAQTESLNPKNYFDLPFRFANPTYPIIFRASLVERQNLPPLPKITLPGCLYDSIPVWITHRSTKKTITPFSCTHNAYSKYILQ